MSIIGGYFNARILFSARKKGDAQVEVIEEYLKSLKNQLVQDGGFESYKLVPFEVALQLFKVKDDSVKQMISRRAKKLGFQIANREESIKRAFELDPTIREKSSEKMRITSRSPEARAKMSKITKKARQNPAVNQIYIARAQDPEVRKKQSEAKLKNWQDPIYRERMLASFNNRIPYTPEQREAISTLRKAVAKRPEVQAKLSAASLRSWQDPAVREKRINNRIKVMKTPEMQEKIKAIFQTPEMRQKMREIATISWESRKAIVTELNKKKKKTEVTVKPKLPKVSLCAMVNRSTGEIIDIPDRKGQSPLQILLAKEEKKLFQDFLKSQNLDVNQLLEIVWDALDSLKNFDTNAYVAVCNQLGLSFEDESLPSLTPTDQKKFYEEGLSHLKTWLLQEMESEKSFLTFLI